ncbi:SulP family inorganic anion transporter [Acidisoma sp. L85]|uniref:SulP family inorganic anion transporter n=1 Tax=Acidisoma sp. L85 TaxID=1641850 RepID=UPI00131E59F3|nr:SulP family inorganic anion transporter [Acidisoma sp. L85]
MTRFDLRHRAPWAFTSLQGWHVNWFPRDLAAGLILAAIAVPEQLATARLAGLPPETGLIAFIAASLGFVIFGASRLLSAGADSTIALIFAGGLVAIAPAGTAEYAHLASLLALMVGAILIAAALLRAGWVADLLSIPVTTGFLAGVSLHIAIGQLPSLLGIAEVSGSLWERLPELLGEIAHLNPYCLMIGLVAICTTLLSEKLAPHLPGALIAILGTSIAIAVFHLKRLGVTMIADFSPVGQAPFLSDFSNMQDFMKLVPLAGIVALVCMMQTAAVARAFAGEGKQLEPISPNFAGVGAGCILSALMGAFSVNASPPRTAALVGAGARSQVASLIAAACTLVLIISGGALVHYVSQAALAGILIVIAIRIFRWSEMVRIMRLGGSEIVLVLASAALVTALPIETGMLYSIVLSLLQSVYAMARPLCLELARVPTTTVWWPPSDAERGEAEPGILVFAPAAPINFTNAVYICRRLQTAVASARVPLRLVVIEASGVVEVDYTGSIILQQTIADLRRKGIVLTLARLSSERARFQAERTGLLSCLGHSAVFRSVEDAISSSISGKAVP